jgi:hypothetical protein
MEETTTGIIRQPLSARDKVSRAAPARPRRVSSTLSNDMGGHSLPHAPIIQPLSVIFPLPQKLMDRLVIDLTLDTGGTEDQPQRFSRSANACMKQRRRQDTHLTLRTKASFTSRSLTPDGYHCRTCPVSQEPSTVGLLISAAESMLSSSHTKHRNDQRQGQQGTKAPGRRHQPEYPDTGRLNQLRSPSARVHKDQQGRRSHLLGEEPLLVSS